MPKVNLHTILQCTCGGSIHIGDDSAICEDCNCRYNIEDGVIDLSTADERSKYEQVYRNEMLSNLIAGFYDVLSPIMCSTVWRCSPIRFIDQTHHVLGQSKGGILLSLPIATGALLKLAQSDYHDVQIVGVDTSMKMLKKAARHFRNHDNTLFVRAFPDNLPFRDHSFGCIHTVNGLHSFEKRSKVFDEFHRVCSSEGVVYGTTIVHGQNKIADLILEQYQNYGVSPPLRKIDFLMEELTRMGFATPSFETHGAVAFFKSNPV